MEYSPSLKAEASTLPPNFLESIRLGASPYLTDTLTTTYTYYNTFSAGQSPVVLTSKETVSNVVTIPAYMSPTLMEDLKTMTHSRVFETETYYTTFTFSKTLLHEGKTAEVKTTQETVTQVVVTEALLPGKPSPVPMLTPLPFIDPQPGEVELEEITKTYFTTYTHWVTKLNPQGGLIVESSTSIGSNVVTDTMAIAKDEDSYLSSAKFVGNILARTPVPHFPSSVPSMEKVLIQATKTYYTTYTYFTTILGTGTEPPRIHSRTQIVSKISTEAISTEMDAEYVQELKNSYLKKHSTMLEVASSIQHIIPTRTIEATTRLGTLVTQNVFHPHWPKDEDRLAVDVEPTTMSSNVDSMEPEEYDLFVAPRPPLYGDMAMNSVHTLGTSSEEHYDEMKEGIHKIVDVLTDTKLSEGALLYPSQSYDDNLYSTEAGSPESDSEDFTQYEEITLKDPGADFPTTGMNQVEIQTEKPVTHIPTPPLKASDKFEGIEMIRNPLGGSTVDSFEKTKTATKASVVIDYPSQFGEYSEDSTEEPSWEDNKKGPLIAQLLSSEGRIIPTTSVLSKRTGSIVFNDILSPTVPNNWYLHHFESTSTTPNPFHKDSDNPSYDDLTYPDETGPQSVYNLSTFDSFSFLKNDSDSNEPYIQDLLVFDQEEPFTESDEGVTEDFEIGTTEGATESPATTTERNTVTKEIPKAPTTSAAKPQRQNSKRPTKIPFVYKGKPTGTKKDSNVYTLLDLEDDLKASSEETDHRDDPESEEDDEPEDDSVEMRKPLENRPQSSYRPKPPPQRHPSKSSYSPSSISTASETQNLDPATGINWKPLLNLGAIGLGGLGASTLTKLGPLFTSVAGYMKGALLPIARNDTYHPGSHNYATHGTRLHERPFKRLPPTDGALIKYNEHPQYIPINGMSGPESGHRHNMRHDDDRIPRIPIMNSPAFRFPPNRPPDFISGPLPPPMHMDEDMMMHGGSGNNRGQNKRLPPQHPLDEIHEQFFNELNHMGVHKNGEMHPSSGGKQQEPSSNIVNIIANRIPSSAGPPTRQDKHHMGHGGMNRRPGIIRKTQRPQGPIIPPSWPSHIPFLPKDPSRRPRPNNGHEPTKNPSFGMEDPFSHLNPFELSMPSRPGVPVRKPISPDNTKVLKPEAPKLKNTRPSNIRHSTNPPWAEGNKVFLNNADLVGDVMKNPFSHDNKRPQNTRGQSKDSAEMESEYIPKPLGPFDSPGNNNMNGHNGLPPDNFFNQLEKNNFNNLNMIHPSILPPRPTNFPPKKNNGDTANHHHMGPSDHMNRPHHMGPPDHDMEDHPFNFDTIPHPFPNGNFLSSTTPKLDSPKKPFHNFFPLEMNFGGPMKHHPHDPNNNPSRDPVKHLTPQLHDNRNQNKQERPFFPPEMEKTRTPNQKHKPPFLMTSIENPESAEMHFTKPRPRPPPNSESAEIQFNRPRPSKNSESDEIQFNRPKPSRNPTKTYNTINDNRRPQESSHYPKTPDKKLPEQPPAPMPPTRRPNPTPVLKPMYPKTSSIYNRRPPYSTLASNSFEDYDHGPDEEQFFHHPSNHYGRPNERRTTTTTTIKPKFESLMPTKFPELVIKEITGRPHTTSSTSSPTEVTNRAKISKLFIRRFSNTTRRPANTVWRKSTTTTVEPPTTTKMTFRPWYQNRRTTGKPVTTTPTTTTTTAKPVKNSDPQTVIESWMINPTINDLLSFEQDFSSKYNAGSKAKPANNTTEHKKPVVFKHPNHRYDTSGEKKKNTFDADAEDLGSDSYYEDDYYSYENGASSNTNVRHRKQNASSLENHRLESPTENRRRPSLNIEKHFKDMADSEFAQVPSGSENRESVIDPKTHGKHNNYPHHGEKDIMSLGESRRNISNFRRRFSTTSPPRKQSNSHTTPTPPKFYEDIDGFTHVPSTHFGDKKLHSLKPTTYKPSLNEILHELDQNVKPTTFRGDEIYATTFRPGNVRPIGPKVYSTIRTSTVKTRRPAPQTGMSSFYDDADSMDQLKLKNMEIHKLSSNRNQANRQSVKPSKSTPAKNQYRPRPPDFGEDGAAYEEEYSVELAPPGFRNKDKYHRNTPHTHQSMRTKPEDIFRHPLRNEVVKKQPLAVSKGRLPVVPPTRETVISSSAPAKQLPQKRPSVINSDTSKHLHPDIKLIPLNPFYKKQNEHDTGGNRRPLFNPLSSKGNNKQNSEAPNEVVVTAVYPTRESIVTSSSKTKQTRPKNPERKPNKDHQAAPSGGQRESIYSDYYSSEYYDEDDEYEIHNAEGMNHINSSPPPTQNLRGMRPRPGFPRSTNPPHVGGHIVNNFKQFSPPRPSPATQMNPPIRRPPFHRPPPRQPPGDPRQRPPGNFGAFHRFQQRPGGNRGHPKTVMEPPPIDSHSLKSPILELPSSGPIRRHPITPLKARPNLLRPKDELFGSPKIQPSSTVHVIASVDEQNKIVGTNVFTQLVSAHPSGESYQETYEDDNSSNYESGSENVNQLEGSESTNLKLPSSSTASVIKYTGGKLETTQMTETITRTRTGEVIKVNPTRTFSNTNNNNSSNRGNVTKVEIEAVQNQRIRPFTRTKLPIPTTEHTTFGTTPPRNRLQAFTRRPFVKPPVETKEPYIPKHISSTTTTITTSEESEKISSSETSSVKTILSSATEGNTALDSLVRRPTTEKVPFRPTTYKPAFNPTTYKPDLNPTTYKPALNRTTYKPSLRPTTYRPPFNLLDSSSEVPANKTFQYVTGQQKPTKATGKNHTDDEYYDDEYYYEEYYDDDEGNTKVVTVIPKKNSTKVSSEIRTTSVEVSTSSTSREEKKNLTNSGTHRPFFVRHHNRTIIKPNRVLNNLRTRGYERSSSVLSSNSQRNEATRYVTHSDASTKIMTDTEIHVVTLSGALVTQTILITRTLPPDTVISTIVGSVTLVNSVEITPTTVRTTIFSQPTRMVEHQPSFEVESSEETVTVTKTVSESESTSINGGDGAKKEENTSSGLCNDKNCPEKFNQLCRSYNNGTRTKCDCKPGYARMKSTYRCRRE